MNSCFINGIGCVSAQNTFENTFFEDAIDISNLNIVKAIKPNYKSFIPPASIRRMSAGVKNSIVASSVAIKEASADQLDGIIVGTGLGCIQDSENFLNKMIGYNEEYLTPTAFIQSTHNTVSGQIALKLKCKAYNFTYVNTGGSFQSALIDGLLMFEGEEANNILIGGVDEHAEYTNKLYQAIGYYRQDEEGKKNILKQRKSGVIPGEGASYFVLGNEQSDSTYAKILDVQLVNKLDQIDLPSFILDFLSKNELKLDEIDVVILGNNGDDEFDTYYDEASSIFESSTLLYYKHLFGEFLTSSSVATYIAAKILREQVIPEHLLGEQKVRKSDKIGNILIYNQYRGKDHSLILMEDV
ncbi:beta-ketoacyl synthase chain length factor [Brumimicrobium aurantiacum]|uniref:3-oxoacyl-ACP synthase n=1 Tax=Brumimicrobium aurantiacum TaxID=1737063 RepID=A0A3E1EZN3_9FLAO|nr:beta-ketoacyl synthase chain length factor [Brumimicrobium aurantiacum]RFC54917.1 3-oxoacyl-ACP synthase [Brumimicrobium aurantiacum]